MAQRKTERLLNLFFLLLATNQYLSKDQIRAAIGDYRESSDSSFERNFERDKEELRELGITVETGHRDRYFDDEPGYRIRRDEAELPDLSFTREEAAVLGLAGQVWERTALAGEAAGALLKLRSIGVDIDIDDVAVGRPHLSASEPAFADLFDAVNRRVPVSFEYQAPGRDPLRRRVEPWGLVSWRDRWYVGGLDLDRDAARVFRLDRVVSDVTTIGRPESYQVPEGIDVRQIVSMLATPDPARRATIRVCTERGQSLRRRAVGQNSTAPDGFDDLHIPYAATAPLVAEVISYAPDAIVLEPVELRDDVLRTLRMMQEKLTGESA